MISKEKKLSIYLNWYWQLYSLLPLGSFALILSYLTGGDQNFIWIVKIPQVGLFLLLIIFYLRFPVRVNFIAALFISGGVIATLVGIFRGSIFSAGLITHVFMTITPILATSFGYQVAKLPHSLSGPIERAGVRKLFILSLLAILTYSIYFYITGQISYFGFDSYLAVPASWYMASSRYSMLLLTIVLIVVSGKRAPLVTILVSFVFTISKSLFSKGAPRFKNIFLISITILVGLWIATAFDILYRYDALFSVDFSDPESLFLATSGRSNEVLGLVVSRNQHPFLWFLGGGYGDGYVPLESSFNDNFGREEAYYTHMSILTYVMVFGFPFAIILLAYIVSTIWMGLKTEKNFYSIGALVFFIWSFFGAVMIVEPMFWFFLGASSYFARAKGPSCVSAAQYNVRN